MLRSTIVMLCLWLMSLAGCQCFRLTNDYANVVDCISDHEHTFERFYVAGWDLNRIGRPDWCAAPKNRRLCRRACNRCKPVPCDQGHYAERTLRAERISQPDWSQRTAPDSPSSPNEDPSTDVWDDDIPPGPELPDTAE